MSSNMKDHYKQPADMLDNIGRVDAPPFLLTRIGQRIANAAAQRVQPVWAVAAGVSLVLVLALNVYVMTGTQKTASPRPQSDLAAAMELYPQNSLYE